MNARKVKCVFIQLDAFLKCWWKYRARGKRKNKINWVERYKRNLMCREKKDVSRNLEIMLGCWWSGSAQKVSDERRERVKRKKYFQLLQIFLALKKNPRSFYFHTSMNFSFFTRIWRIYVMMKNSLQ